MPPTTIKKAALTFRARIEGGKRLIETEAGFLPETQAGVVIDETPLETTMATRVAGERPLEDQAGGGLLAARPATTHSIRVTANTTKVLAPPDSTGGVNDWVLEILFNVNDPAASGVTITDGLGVEADGAIKDFPLLKANQKPVGSYRETYVSLRSVTGPYTIKTAAGVDLVVGIISK